MTLAWLLLLALTPLPIPVILWSTWGVDPQQVWPWVWFVVAGFLAWLFG